MSIEIFTNSCYLILCSYQLDTLDQVNCQTMVTKALPTCGHSAKMACYQDPASSLCNLPCDVELACCSTTCRGTCGTCQTFSPTPHHKSHTCSRSLICGHTCGGACEIGHICRSACSQSCLQKCSHRGCKNGCGVACTPCVEDCDWACPHQGSCLVQCGTVRPSSTTLHKCSFLEAVCSTTL